MVMTMSHPATSAIVDAGTAPAATRSAPFVAVLFQIFTGRLAANRLRAMACPMLPSPMNPTAFDGTFSFGFVFIDSASPSEAAHCFSE
jgi:hypothetical protein